MTLSKKQNDWWTTGFSAEAQAVFDLMDTDPPKDLKRVMAIGIDEMVADGNFAELGQLLVVLDTSANSLIDWIGNQNALAVNSPIFDAFDFWEFNGTTQYINTQLTPSVNTRATQNSADYGVFVVSHDTPSGTEVIMGERTNASRNVTVASTGAAITTQVHQQVGLSDATEASFASNSLYSGRREDSANVELFKNGVQVDSGAIVSTIQGVRPIYFGARNAVGTADLFFGGKLACYYAGSSIINNLNLFNTLNTMITAIAELG